jgi:hypothetical protein
MKDDDVRRKAASILSIGDLLFNRHDLENIKAQCHNLLQPQFGLIDAPSNSNPGFGPALS